MVPLASSVTVSPARTAMPESTHRCCGFTRTVLPWRPGPHRARRAARRREFLPREHAVAVRIAAIERDVRPVPFVARERSVAVVIERHKLIPRVVGSVYAPDDLEAAEDAVTIAIEIREHRRSCPYHSDRSTRPLLFQSRSSKLVSRTSSTSPPRNSVWSSAPRDCDRRGGMSRCRNAIRSR